MGFISAELEYDPSHTVQVIVSEGHGTPEWSTGIGAHPGFETRCFIVLPKERLFGFCKRALPAPVGFIVLHLDAPFNAESVLRLKDFAAAKEDIATKLQHLHAQRSLSAAAACFKTWNAMAIEPCFQSARETELGYISARVRVSERSTVNIIVTRGTQKPAWSRCFGELQQDDAMRLLRYELRDAAAFETVLCGSVDVDIEAALVAFQKLSAEQRSVCEMVMRYMRA